MRVHFGAFTLDPAARQLTREGHPRHLSPKAFALLEALVRARPRVLTKADLHALLWPAAFVADANLSNLVAEVRRALDDDAAAPRYLRTAHSVGYAFIGAVDAGAATEHEPCRCWLEWGRHRFALAPGVHVIGRDPDADIRLDAGTVSRRHARIVVGQGGVQLEDLASKNGTFRGSMRVGQPVPLADGDAVRIGALQLTVYLARADRSTDTHVEAQ